MLTWHQYLKANAKYDEKAKRLLHFGGSHPGQTRYEIERKGGDEIDEKWLALYERSYNTVPTEMDQKVWQPLGNGCHMKRTFKGA